MLKKTLIATAAISATLLAAATVLPALAQSRSIASAGTAAVGTQATATSGPQDKRSTADDKSGRTSAIQSERDQDRRKAGSSERDDRDGEEVSDGSLRKEQERRDRKSRD